MQDEIRNASGTYERKKKFIQGSDGETRSKETI